jgi:hypothetical protein
VASAPGLALGNDAHLTAGVVTGESWRSHERLAKRAPMDRGRVGDIAAVAAGGERNVQIDRCAKRSGPDDVRDGPVDVRLDVLPGMARNRTRASAAQPPPPVTCSH